MIMEMLKDTFINLPEKLLDQLLSLMLLKILELLLPKQAQILWENLLLIHLLVILSEALVQSHPQIMLAFNSHNMDFKEDSV